jgi:5-methylcytosine-specific restriction endonuclease McrA
MDGGLPIRSVRRYRRHYALNITGAFGIPISDQELLRRKRDPEAARAAYRKWASGHADKVHENNRKYYAKNRDRLREANRNWRRSDEGKRYYEEHRNEILAKVRERLRLNPDSREKRNSTWRKYNKSPLGNACMRRKCAKRRAAKYGTPISARLTAAEWQKIKLSYGYRCVYCGKKKPLTQDHVVPLKLGGGHTKGNVVPSCQPCNSSKKTRSLMEIGRGIQLVLI